MSACTGPYCDRQGRARGLCPAHYAQQRAGHDLTPIQPRSPRPERDIACPECGARPGEGCWVWHEGGTSRHERGGFHTARTRALDAP